MKKLLRGDLCVCLYIYIYSLIHYSLLVKELGKSTVLCWCLIVHRPPPSASPNLKGLKKRNHY